MTLTPGDFRSLMLRLAEQSDVESRRQQMEKLICRTLESLGYAGGIDVFLESMAERRHSDHSGVTTWYTT